MAHGPSRARTFARWRTVCCAALALFAVAAGPMLLRRFYVADDLGAFHLPLRWFYARQLAAGEPFDWHPGLFAGFYVTGEGQLGGYHPWHWLLYRSLPLQAAMGWELLSSYLFLFAGTAMFLRRQGLARDASAFGALVLSASGFCLLHFPHPNAIAVMAHLPWLLCAIDNFLTSASSVSPHVSSAHLPIRNTSRLHHAGVAIALLTGSQLLLGYPQYVWFSLLAEAVHVALIGKQRGMRANCAARLLPWLALGVLLGAVQLLPTWETLDLSTRQEADAKFAATGSLDPINFLQMLVPYLSQTRVLGKNTHELGCYIGAVPLALAVWVLSNLPKGPARQTALAAALGAILAALLATGEFGPFHRLQLALPIVGKFRFSCRAIVLVHLSLAVLSALGWHRLWRTKEASRRGPLFFLPVLSLAAASATPWLVPAEFRAPWPLVLAGPAMFLAAALAIDAAARHRPWAATALAALTAVDLGSYGLSYALLDKTATWSEVVRATDAPPGARFGRAAVDVFGPKHVNSATGNRLPLVGWDRLDGYAGLKPRRALDYRSDSALRLANVHWVRRPAAAHRALCQWQPVPGALPRARFVVNARVSADVGADLREIDPRDTALVDAPLALELGVPGTVEIVSDRPGNIRMLARVQTAQLLVLAEAYHPGWHATLDGAPSAVQRVFGDFQGVCVPAGCHDINFHFAPRSLRVGRALSLAGLCIAGFVAVAPCARGLARFVRDRVDRASQGLRGQQTTFNEPNKHTSA